MVHSAGLHLYFVDLFVSLLLPLHPQGRSLKITKKVLEVDMLDADSHHEGHLNGLISLLMLNEKNHTEMVVLESISWKVMMLDALPMKM